MVNLKGQGCKCPRYWPWGDAAAMLPDPFTATEHETASWIALGLADRYRLPLERLLLRGQAAPISTLLQEVTMHGCFPGQLQGSHSTKANLGGSCIWLGLATHSCFLDQHLGNIRLWLKLAACGRCLDGSLPKLAWGRAGSRDLLVTHPPLPLVGLWAAISFPSLKKGERRRQPLVVPFISIRAALHH